MCAFFVCTTNIEKLPIIENKLKMNYKVNYKNESKVNTKFQKVLRQMKNEEAMKRNVREEREGIGSKKFKTARNRKRMRKEATLL